MPEDEGDRSRPGRLAADHSRGRYSSLMRFTRRITLLLPALLLAGCGPSAAVPPPLPTLAPAPTPALALSNPQHASLPLDESPHGDLTEWWYYTGHLAAQDGRHYGFELVFFQIRRGDAPPGYEAHFAVTDEHRNTFQFKQRSGTGEQGGRGPGFNLALGTWHMQGSQGHDALQAQMTDYAINLQLLADKPAALHGGTGLIDFGPFGKSYYYSYTRMAVSGTLHDHGQPLTVGGIAWMDHQWGNFIVGSVGGWDWYALQLDDGSDIMLSFNRDATNRQYFSYGSYVSEAGVVTDLANGTFSHQATGSWTSLATGIVYGLTLLFLPIGRYAYDHRVTAALARNKEWSADAKRRENERASRRDDAVTERSEREERERRAPIIEQERREAAEAAAQAERERQARTEDARAEVMRFYDQHEALLSESLPPALFRTQLQNQFPAEIPPEQAWQAAQDMIAGMLPMIAEGRTRVRADGEKAQKRADRLRQVRRKLVRLEEKRQYLANSREGEEEVTGPELRTLEAQIRALREEEQAIDNPGQERLL